MLLQNAVIDTLVAAVQGLPGDDRCVLMLGYKAEMQRLFDDCNPGLARRFQWSQPWVFDDYTKEELRQIVQTAAKKYVPHSKNKWQDCMAGYVPHIAHT